MLIAIAVLHTAAKTRQSGSIKFLTGVAGMDVDVFDKANQVELYNLLLCAALQDHGQCRFLTCAWVSANRAQSPSFCCLQTALHTAFDSFVVFWHPCTPAFRETVLALLAAGMLAP